MQLTMLNILISHIKLVNSTPRKLIRCIMLCIPLAIAII